MTTIKRELTTFLKDILQDVPDLSLTPEQSDSASGWLSGEILSEYTVTKKFKSDPNWDLGHGNAIQDTSRAYQEEQVHNVALRLEAGLRRNLFPETPSAQKVYKWILEQEAKGEKLEVWMRWATQTIRNEYSFKYQKDPQLIIVNWNQAFDSGNANKQSGRHIQLLEREEE